MHKLPKLDIFMPLKQQIMQSTAKCDLYVKQHSVHEKHLVDITEF